MLSERPNRELHRTSLIPNRSWRRLVSGIQVLELYLDSWQGDKYILSLSLSDSASSQVDFDIQLLFFSFILGQYTARHSASCKASLCAFVPRHHFSPHSDPRFSIPGSRYKERASSRNLFFFLKKTLQASHLHSFFKHDLECRVHHLSLLHYARCRLK
jgi:hypothetical protein